MNRRLFKHAARADSAADLANAAELHKEFGSAETRRRLEQEAARVAGVNPGWKVVIWLPATSMRMKIARVLVDDGSGIAALDDVGDTSGAIADAHKRRWAITIYVAPDLVADHPTQVGAMLGYLRDKLGVAFHDGRGRPIQRSNEYALQLFSDRASLTAADSRRLEQAFALKPAAAGMSGTFEERLQVIAGIARSEELTAERVSVADWTDWSKEA